MFISENKVRIVQEGRYLVIFMFTHRRYICEDISSKTNPTKSNIQRSTTFLRNVVVVSWVPREKSKAKALKNMSSHQNEYRSQSLKRSGRRLLSSLWHARSIQGVLGLT